MIRISLAFFLGITSLLQPAGGGGGYGCPCTIWTESDTGSDSGDNPAITLGVRFRADAAGYVGGVRYYKPNTTSGTRTGYLWSNDCGTQLGSVTFSGDTTAGWHQADFASPIAISADTTYVIGYHATINSRYAFTSGYFSSSGHYNEPLYAVQDGEGYGSNAVYNYESTASCPTSTFGSANYWTEPVFCEASDCSS